MKLIKGEELNQRQTEQVLSAYVYRWTTGNCARERAWATISKPTVPLQSDHEWINDHAFWFINDGSRLAVNRHHAEPAFLAD